MIAPPPGSPPPPISSETPINSTIVSTYHFHLTINNITTFHVNTRIGIGVASFTCESTHTKHAFLAVNTDTAENRTRHASACTNAMMH